MGERVTALEEWVKGHEALCADRYNALRGDMRWIIRGLFGMLIGVAGWLAVQLHAASQQRLDQLEHPAAPVRVIQQPGAPTGP